jgi:cyclic pyranopterin phosphate synthase
MIDPFGREVTYLRVSVTDRCDFRCIYCMSEDMTFLPKPELLSLEELDRLCSAFIRKGVRKLRVTGGEPLVRRDIMGLFQSLSRHLKSGDLQELTVTTNGSQLARYADDLAAAGVRRINVSLDSLNDEKFSAITRRGNLSVVKDGLQAAKEAGLQVKINTVAMQGGAPLGNEDADGRYRWRPGRPVPTAKRCPGRDRSILHAPRQRLPNRRPGSLCHGCGNWTAHRLYHAA